MLTSNEKTILEEIERELRAIQDKERSVFFSGLKERLPGKLLAQMNTTLLGTILICLSQLRTLNEGEFEWFCNMYPSLWAKIGLTEAEWAERRRLLDDEWPFWPFPVTIGRAERSKDCVFPSPSLIRKAETD